MPHSEQLLLLDAGGKPIPQFFNPVADRFRPVTGADLGDGRYGMDIVPWGKTSGGLYVPIRVTDEGAQEVALNGSIVDTEDNVLRVKQYENTLSRETVVLPREVRRVTTATIQVRPPDGLHAKGVSLILRVFGVTGTFDTNEGIYLLSGQTGGAYPGYGSFYVATDRLTAPGFITTIWYPGIRSDGVNQSVSSMFKTVSIPFSLGYIRLEITGSFDTGQGFDCEVRAIWWV